MAKKQSIPTIKRVFSIIDGLELASIHLQQNESNYIIKIEFYIWNNDWREKTENYIEDEKTK